VWAVSRKYVWVFALIACQGRLAGNWLASGTIAAFMHKFAYFMEMP